MVFTGLYVLESKATGDIEAIKSPLNVYVPLVLLAVFALWPPLAARLKWLRPVTAFLARHSMTVYFGHVLILSMLRDRPEFIGMRGMLLLLAEVTVLAIPWPGAWIRPWTRRAPRCTGGKRLPYHKNKPRGTCRGLIFMLW